MKPRRRQLLAATLAAPAAAIVAPRFVREAFAAEPEERFALGVASGQPAADGMVLWTRLVGAALPPRVEVAWEVAHDEAFERIAARGVEDAVADDAHSVHAEPRGLDPDRWYFYRFRALGQRSRIGRTRTAPAADAAVARLDFTIASCQRYDHGHFAAWRDAAASAPDLILFLGDYIYEYATPPDAKRVRAHDGGPVRTLDGYRARHAQVKRDPQLQAAHAACPWLLVWDDHEVDNDYAGLQGAALQPDFAEQRAAAYRAYWEHLPLPTSSRPRDGAMRLHGRLDWGTLARLHLLDNRQHRDPQACPRPGRGGANVVRGIECAALADPARSMLGLAQERWLESGWDTQRPWNLVAQQTLMARFAWGSLPEQSSFWTDGWDGYAPSRARLLGAVAQRKLPGAVVLGGDVHTHYVADLKVDFDEAASPVVASEFCSSSITSENGAGARLGLVVPLNPHIRHARWDKRGTMRFRLDAKRLEADLRIVDDVLDAASPVRSDSRWVVELGRPGAQRA